MAKVHLYLPDELKRRADEHDLNLSELLRRALIPELKRRETAAGAEPAAVAASAGQRG